MRKTNQARIVVERMFDLFKRQAPSIESRIAWNKCARDLIEAFDRIDTDDKTDSDGSA